MTVIIGSPIVAVIIAVCTLAPGAHAGRHMRLYACVIASDAPGAFMGGSSLGSGLWISDDTARSWRQVGWKHVKCYSVDLDPRSNGSTIYLACGNGVLKSTDAGASWRMMTDHRITEVLDVRVNPDDSKRIFIATPRGVWLSTDAGAKWSDASNGLAERFTERINYDARNTGFIYATTEGGLYQSTTGGNSWEYYSISARTSYRYFAMDPYLDILMVGDSGVIHHENRKTIRDREKYGDLWTCDIFRRDAIVGGERGAWIIDNDLNVDTIPRAPQNIHDIYEFSKVMMIATLGEGVWRHQLSDYTAFAKPSGLEHAQVWTVRGYPVDE